MSELEDKLTSVLNNPQMMQQIMSLAQSMNQGETEKGSSQESSPVSMPNIDLGMLQKLSGITQQSRVDDHQQALLQALTPYLNRSRVEKLERAMRAAKMTELASGLLGSGALQALSGR